MRRTLTVIHEFSGRANEGRTKAEEIAQQVQETGQALKLWARCGPLASVAHFLLVCEAPLRNLEVSCRA
jgi:hypothetical protein